MIDHVLGRPSVKFRKIQVFCVVCLWTLYLHKGDSHGPPFLRRLSKLISKKLTAWQTVVSTLLWLYVARNFGKLVGLECPEPLANLYSRAYFRATWITTALDAGFWTAMGIRRKWARDFLSMVFSVYYLFSAEQADEKVRKIRGTLTLDHLRVSWDKPNTPYLNFLGSLLRPRFMRYPPRAIRIPRPRASAYKEPVQAWLYFEGPLSELKRHTKIVLDVPGGGFVAMSPRTHDDKLMAWAGKTGLPVLSLNYKKAPEYPYPYALNECYDVYHTLITSKGRCIGLSGLAIPKIVVCGDSAGGNLAVGMLLMILQAGSSDSRQWQGDNTLPVPEGLVLIYPALDMNIGNWMTDEQMALIQDRRVRKTNKGVLNRKSDDYRKLTPATPHHSDEDLDDYDPSPPGKEAKGDSTVTVIKATSSKLSAQPSAAHDSDSKPYKNTTSNSKPRVLKTRLAMSSMISYFNDRILSPEMMRAMIILYVGPHNRPDFSTDYLLCPVLAPENLLARFPKTHILTGERDPLVDDTVIFAGRLRQAHAVRLRERKELGLEKERREFREEDHVEVVLVPGISHGFLQFVSIFPEGWKYIFRCGRWIVETFDRADREDDDEEEAVLGDEDEDEEEEEEEEDVAMRRSMGRTDSGGVTWDGRPRRHIRRIRTESSGDEDRPLEMTRLSNQAGGSSRSRSNTVASGRTERKNREATKENNAKRKKSLVSLASEDDLLGRRMHGLAGGLMGVEVLDTPPTP